MGDSVPVTNIKSFHMIKADVAIIPKLIKHFNMGIREPKAKTKQNYNDNLELEIVHKEISFDCKGKHSKASQFSPA